MPARFNATARWPALRRKFAQQVGEVNQVLGNQVADFARTLCGGKSCQVDAFV